MILKSLAAGVLALSAGTAAGALLKDGYTPGTPSDVLVAIYDDSVGLAQSGKTLLYNTRLSYADFVNGTVTSKAVNLSCDANFQTLKSGGGKLKFNIVGGYSLANDFSNYDKTGSSGRPFSDKAGTQWGVVTTGKRSADFNGEFGNLSDTAKGRIIAYWNAANVKLSAAGATANAGANSVLVDKGDRLASFDLAWGGNFGGGGIANVGTANLVNGPGDTAKFFWVTNTDFDKGSVIELGSWTLSESGQLAYTGAGGAAPAEAGCGDTGGGGGGGGGGSGGSGGGGSGGGAGGTSNQAPVANAGSGRSVTVGTLVTLDGSGSSDPNGDPLTYAWSRVSGPDAALSGDGTARASFTPATAGTYVFKLVVSDGTASSEARVQVTARDAPRTGPFVTLRVPSTWKAGRPQTIAFSANQINTRLKATVRYSKDGGNRYRAIRSIPLRNARFNWRPARSHVSTQGVIEICVRYDRNAAPACDRANVVVNR